jgi:hypothetical protein
MNRASDSILVRSKGKKCIRRLLQTPNAPDQREVRTGVHTLARGKVNGDPDLSGEVRNAA